MLRGGDCGSDTKGAKGGGSFGPNWLSHPGISRLELPVASVSVSEEMSR